MLLNPRTLYQMISPRNTQTQIKDIIMITRMITAVVKVKEVRITRALKSRNLKVNRSHKNLKSLNPHRKYPQ